MGFISWFSSTPAEIELKLIAVFFSDELKMWTFKNMKEGLENSTTDQTHVMGLLIIISVDFHKSCLLK